MALRDQNDNDTLRRDESSDGEGPGDDIAANYEYILDDKDSEKLIMEAISKVITTVSMKISSMK